MVLNATELSEIVNDEIWPDARTKWGANRNLRKQMLGLTSRVWMPEGADAEYKDLMRKARSPWLEFVAQAISQGLIVDDYSDTEVWKQAWQANGMSGRQGALNLEVVRYGYSYLLSFPAEGSGVMMRPLSALSTFSANADEWDEEPDHVLHRAGRDTWRLFDSEAMYEWKAGDRQPGRIDDDDLIVTPHELGANPVTPILSEFSLGGPPDSLIEPAIPVYKRIVDATFTLLMGQRYGAFPQKSQSGGEIATDEAGNALIKPSIDSLLHSDDPGTKFDSFSAADLSKMIEAVDAHVKHLSAVMQVPPHYLLGTMANMSAEALAAAETGYFRRNARLQTVMGEGYERALRVAAAFLNMPSEAANTSSTVHWQDATFRPLAQVTDAVQKLDSSNAPLDKVFSLMPGWTTNEAREAAASVYRFRGNERRRQERSTAPPASGSGRSTTS